jgi:hypothetical protein
MEVLRQLSAEVPESERAAMAQPDPQGLARMATRAELRQPGVLERLFGARTFAPAGMGGIQPGGVGLGGMMAGTLLSSIAGTFIGSAIAHQFLDGFERSPEHHGLFDSAQGAQDSDADRDAADLTDHDQYADNSHDDAVDTDDADYDDDGDFGGDDFDV